MKKQRKGPLLFALFLLFLLVWNSPFIESANNARFTAGIPQLYVYILITWLMAIGLIAWIVKTRP